MVGAVLEMNKHPVELNGASLDSDLDRPKIARRIDGNFIVIDLAVDVGLAQQHPVAISIRMRSRSQPQKQAE